MATSGSTWWRVVKERWAVADTSNELASMAGISPSSRSSSRSSNRSNSSSTTKVGRRTPMGIDSLPGARFSGCGGTTCSAIPQSRASSATGRSQSAPVSSRQGSLGAIRPVAGGGSAGWKCWIGGGGASVRP